MIHYLPDQLLVNFEVMVHENVPQPDQLRPNRIGEAFGKKASASIWPSSKYSVSFLARL